MKLVITQAKTYQEILVELFTKNFLKLYILFKLNDQKKEKKRKKKEKEKE